MASSAPLTAAARGAASASAPALPTTFSFSGAGWLAAYHLGAVRAIQERPRLLKESTFIGASGGALASAVAALDGDCLKTQDFLKKRAMAARSWPIDLFRLRALIKDGVKTVVDDVYEQKETGNKKRVDGTDSMDDVMREIQNDYMQSPEVLLQDNIVLPSWTDRPSILQREKAAKAKAQALLLEGKSTGPAQRDWSYARGLLKDRCHIYMTGLPSFKTYVTKDFESQETLTEALCASSCIPPFAGMPFRLKHHGSAGINGALVIDGGFTNLLPRRKERDAVITVSPFVQLPYHVDVSPLVHGHGMVLRWALLPPDALQLDAVFWCGYRDMDSFLVHNRYDDIYGDRRKALATAMERVTEQLHVAQEEAAEAQEALEDAVKKESAVADKKGGSKKSSSSPSSSSSSAPCSSASGKKSVSAKKDASPSDEAVDANVADALQLVTSENKTLAAKAVDAKDKALAVQTLSQELHAIAFLQQQKLSTYRKHQVFWVNKHVLRFMPTLTIYYLRVIWSFVFFYLLFRFAKFMSKAIERKRAKGWKLI